MNTVPQPFTLPQSSVAPVSGPRISAHDPSLYLDMNVLRQLLHEVNQRNGFVPDPAIIPEMVQQMSIQDGHDPTDNLSTSTLMELREEKVGPLCPN